MLSTDVQSAIDDYQRDGAAVLRGVVPQEWIGRLSRAVDQWIDGDDSNHVFSSEGKGRFLGQNFLWLRDPEIKDFIFDGGLAELAARIMGVPQVRFFYDQMLVKEPGATGRTPWHQDLSYWPLVGEQILSMWLPMDSASPENGVVTYVRGSHRWNRFYPIQAFGDEQANVPRVELEANDNLIYDHEGHQGELRTLADVRHNPEKYELITWNVEPGDAIIHHPLIIHGAPGNASPNRRRRALSIRWLGDDVRWDDSRPHFMRHLRGTDWFPYPVLDQGDAPEAKLFPVVWRAPE